MRSPVPLVASFLVCLPAFADNTLGFDSTVQSLPPRQALEQLARVGDSSSSGVASLAIAYLDEMNRDPLSARARYSEAVRNQTVPEFAALAAEWIARLLSESQRVQSAISWYDIAISEFRKSNQTASLARALYKRALLTPPSAERRQLLDEAFHQAEYTADRRTIATIEAEWGESLRMAGQLAPAIEHLLHASVELSAEKQWSEVAQAQASLARTYLLHGEAELADSALAQARQASQKSGDAVGLLKVQIQQAVFWSTTGQRGRARQELDELRKLASEHNAPPALKIRMASVAMGYLQIGEFSAAADVAQSVIAALPRRAPPVAFRVLGIAQFFLGQYDEAVKTLVLASDRAGDSAFNQREAHRFRARALLRLERPQEAASAILEACRHDATIRNSLIDLDASRLAFDEIRAPLANDVVNILWQAGRLPDALATVETFRARALFDELAGRRPSSTLDPATTIEISTIAQRTNSAIISYWVTKDAVYAWVTSPAGTVSAFRSAITSQRLDALIKRARTFTTNPDYSAWRSLYRVLIRPLEKALDSSTKSIAIIPHGPLQTLPFGALLRPDGRFLAERYAIRSAPAASLLNRHEIAPIPAAILLAGAPSHPKVFQHAQLLQPLAGAKKEILAIAKIAQNAKVLIGGNALAADILRELEHAGVIHFATHAVFDSKHPRQSFLALSEGGSLSVEDISNLKLNSSIVVLSACRGGLGRISPDGIDGFPRTFLLAGASSVLAPLWDVPDQPTALLMTEFYRRFLAGTPAAQSLQSAQRKLLSDLRAGRVSVQTPAGPVRLSPHPALWAGFVLQGAQ